MAVGKKDIEKALIQLRKTEAHREVGAEKEIRRVYKELLKDLKQFVGYEYAELAEEGKLTYDILQRKGEFARFLEEVEQRVSGISPKVSQEITKLVEDTYKLSYDGMEAAVAKSATTQELKQALSGMTAATPETIKRAVENPVSGLTLKDTLEKNRREIIYDIKRSITTGLANGDRAETMAKRIAKSVDGDYQKAIRIARTETHRIREAGMHDAAADIDTKLSNGVSGQRLVKTWRTMGDRRVRDTHGPMDGTTIPVDKEFSLPSGHKTKAPGQSGVASEDIHCRCYLSYDFADNMVGDSTDKFYKTAKKAEPQITSDMKEIVSNTKGELTGLEYRLKGEDSLKRKVSSDMFANGLSERQMTQRVYDAVRYTTLTDPNDFYRNYTETVRLLKAKGYTVKRVKNTFKKDAPYKGLNTVVESKDGFKFELQFHTHESFEKKQGILHELYEMQRLTTTSQEEKIALALQMEEISNSIVLPKNVGKIANFTDLD